MPPADAMKLSETCPCGGSFSVEGKKDDAREELRTWRRRHPSTHTAQHAPSGATSGDVSLRWSETTVTGGGQDAIRVKPR